VTRRRQVTKYDLVVIGGGPGGYIAALTAAEQGLKTCLIEEGRLGGACLSWGCMFSKCLIASARMLAAARTAAQFGLTGVDFSAIRADWGGMVDRANTMVSAMGEVVSKLLEQSGVVLIHGHGEVVEAKRARLGVRVNKRDYEAENLVIATGSHYELPESLNDGMSEASGSKTGEVAILTPKSLPSLQELPERLAVVGAGVIGVEYAGLFSQLGVETHLVEMQKPLMPYLDGDARASLRDSLAGGGVILHEAWSAEGVDGKGLAVSREGERRRIPVQAVLYCGRRRASLSGVEHLVSRGLAVKNGYIRTDVRSRTNMAGIYAVGDVNGRIMLTAVASREAITAGDTIRGRGADLVYDLMPYSMYGSPEIASVGLTEERALEQGFLAASGVFPLSANARALAEGRERGFVKVVYDKGSRELLGVHIVAENASEMIGEAALLIQTGKEVWDVAAAVHPHPTLAETMLEAMFKRTQQPVE
jgi:dihydrolipoamide dehydrogenase